MRQLRICTSTIFQLFIISVGWIRIMELLKYQGNRIRQGKTGDCKVESYGIEVINKICREHGVGL